MNDELTKFLEEGMKKYKEASRLMFLFGNIIEKILQEILEKRKNWGIFVPQKTKKTRSTRYWSEYPLLNAEIYGTINSKKCLIRIEINWYESDTEYPFYTVCFRDSDSLDNFILNKIINYQSENLFGVYKELGLKMYPDPNNFDLFRDFNLLIDEFVKIISQ